MLKEFRKIWILALVFSLALLLPHPSLAQDPAQQEPIPAQGEPAVGPDGESSAAPEEDSGEMSPEEARKIGYGIGSVFASALYSPLKVTYAGLGLITGGLGYVLSGGRPEVANNIIYPAVRGSYLITPSQLKGAKPVMFVGPTPQPPGQPQPDPPSEPPPRD